MDSAQITGMVALIVSVVGAIVGVINHKRIRSNCFGKKLEVSLDIDSTSNKVSPKQDSPLSVRAPEEKKVMEV